MQVSLPIGPGKAGNPLSALANDKAAHDQWPEIASQVVLFVSAPTVKAVSAARHTGLNASDIVFVSVTSNAFAGRLDSAL